MIQTHIPDLVAPRLGSPHLLSCNLSLVSGDHVDIRLEVSVEGLNQLRFLDEFPGDTGEEEDENRSIAEEAITLSQEEGERSVHAKLGKERRGR